MKKLKRHDLEPELVFEYFYEALDGGNMLSKILLEAVDLKKGHLFTLLPPEADLSRLYQFSIAGIMPQGKMSFYEGFHLEDINTTRATVSRYIFDIMQKNSMLSLLCDAVTRYATDENDQAIFLSSGVCCDRDVYYLIKSSCKDYRMILEALQDSNAFWHTLSILTETNFDDIDNRQLTQTKIRMACSNVHLICVGAYDGEGYVFWEPNSI